MARQSIALLANLTREAEARCAPIERLDAANDIVICQLRIGANRYDLGTYLNHFGTGLRCADAKRGSVHLPYFVNELGARKNRSGLWRFANLPHPAALLARARKKAAQPLKPACLRFILVLGVSIVSLKLIDNGAGQKPKRPCPTNSTARRASSMDAPSRSPPWAKPSGSWAMKRQTEPDRGYGRHRLAGWEVARAWLILNTLQRVVNCKPNSATRRAAFSRIVRGQSQSGARWHRRRDRLCLFLSGGTARAGLH